jgi:DNA-directed RNA polymerase specialized sigma24 family protein
MNGEELMDSQIARQNAMQADVPPKKRQPKVWPLGRPTDAQIASALARGDISHGQAIVLRAAITHQFYDEIAAATGVNIGTVKSRLNRARAALGVAVGAES